MTEKDYQAYLEERAKLYEVEAKRLFYRWLFRALLWVVWFISFLVWIYQDPTLFFGLCFGAWFVIPVFFNPLFYYLLLGIFLWIFADMAFGKEPMIPHV